MMKIKTDMIMTMNGYNDGKIKIDQHLLVVIDVHSRRVFAALMRHKNEAAAKTMGRSSENSRSSDWMSDEQINELCGDDHIESDRE